MKYPLPLVPLIAALALTNCSFPKVQSSPRLQHVVVTWLKDAGNSEHRKRLMRAGEQLRSVPGVMSVEMGHCLPSKRPVVDSSYDVAFIMTFRNEADLHAYEVNATHVKLVQEVLKPLTRKIVVYDFMTR